MHLHKEYWIHRNGGSGVGWLGDEWKWDFRSLLMAVWILNHVNILHIETSIVTLK